MRRPTKSLYATQTPFKLIGVLSTVQKQVMYRDNLDRVVVADAGLGGVSKQCQMKIDAQLPSFS